MYGGDPCAQSQLCNFEWRPVLWCRTFARQRQCRRNGTVLVPIEGRELCQEPRVIVTNAAITANDKTDDHNHIVAMAPAVISAWLLRPAVPRNTGLVAVTRR